MNTVAKVTLQQTADALAFSALVWFSTGTGSDHMPVRAAFADARDAFDWAGDHRGDFVHFPTGSALSAGIAHDDGLNAWLRRAGL